MQPDDNVARVNVDSEPVVGQLKAGEEISMPGGGKMTFVSSAPFEKDGQKYRRVISLRDKKRTFKKKIMRDLKMNGKQFRKWERKMRSKDAVKTNG